MAIGMGARVYDPRRADGEREGVVVDIHVNPV